MTFHIKKLGVKIGIRIMQGLIALKKGLTFLIRGIVFPVRFFWHIFWALIGRFIILGIVRLSHAVRLQKSVASRPLTLIFVMLFSVALIYSLFRPELSANTMTIKKEGEIVESIASPFTTTDGEENTLFQSVEALPILPGADDFGQRLPTISGGNALLAPSINTTQIENRLREGPETYIVQEGDTLSDIAARFGISIETILWENKLSLRSILRPAMELTILPVSGLSYTIRRGETIASIAKRYKVEERTILAFNEITDAGSITIGQKLIIPEAEQIVSPSITRPSPSTKQPIARVPASTKLNPSGLRLLVPVAYRRISQWFTYRHSGIDMAGTYGIPVVAAEDGVVVQAGWGTGYGLYVLIDHGNGLMTRYGHSSKILVSRGEEVTRGQNIALLGSTGRSTGPHVHFETIVNGRFVNPLLYITL